MRTSLKLLSKKPESEKVLFKMIASVLEEFPFDLSTVKDECLVKEDANMEDAHEEDAEEPEDHVESALSQKRTRCVCKSRNLFLPELYRHLASTERTKNIFRAPIALSIVNVLLKFDKSAFESQLPKLLTILAQCLRDRQQEIRDSVRVTLTKITSMIGPFYFSFIVQELVAALTRGPQIHVLSFTVHSLLKAGNFSHGSIDHCVGKLSEIFINDIFRPNF